MMHLALKKIRSFILVTILLILLAPNLSAQPHTNVYVGMWSYHPLPSSGCQGNMRNDLIGVSYRSFFASTFVNTFNKRSYAAGIQRYWISTLLAPSLHFDLGYRLGLIYGYGPRYAKQRFGIASELLPCPQLIADLTWKHAGLQLSWTAGILLSAGFYLRF